jgi:hypothetical protein
VPLSAACKDLALSVQLSYIIAHRLAFSFQLSHSKTRCRRYLSAEALGAYLLLDLLH